jgi:hypothetical protein
MQGFRHKFTQLIDGLAIIRKLQVSAIKLQLSRKDPALAFGHIALMLLPLPLPSLLLLPPSSPAACAQVS